MEELRKRLKERDQEFKTMREAIAKIEPVVDFVNSFDRPAELKKFLEFFQSDYEYPPGDPLRPLEAEFSPWISNKLDEIVKREGITQAEAIERLVTDGWKAREKGYKRMMKRAKACGLPMSREDYEKQKKKRARK